MAETLSGSITLKRLKKGVNVIVTIETENAALYQGWNDKLGAASPSFKTAANQPILVPKAVASNGQSASITNGAWYYNDTLLVRSNTDAGSGFYKCTDTRFAINPTNFKLRIIDDVASAGNTSNDLFRFTCSGEAANTTYTSEATAELHLQTVGSSAAALYISGGSTLSSTNTKETLTAHFFIDGEEMTTGYTYVWKKENNAAFGGNAKTCVVSRDDIDAIGGIYCSVYRTGDSSKSILATDFHKMVDIADELELEVTVDRDFDYNEATGEETAQKVTAKVYKFVAGQKGEEVTNVTASKFTHAFVSSSTGIDCGKLTGNPVTVGNSIWSKAKNEDVIDFVTYSV